MCLQCELCSGVAISCTDHRLSWRTGFHRNRFPTSRSHQDVIEYELHLSFWYKIKRFEDCKLREPNQIHISWPCMLLLSSLHTEPKVRKIRNLSRYLNTCLCQHDLLRGLSSFKSDLHVKAPLLAHNVLAGDTWLDLLVGLGSSYACPSPSCWQPMLVSVIALHWIINTYIHAFHFHLRTEDSGREHFKCFFYSLTCFLPCLWCPVCCYHFIFEKSK